MSVTEFQMKTCVFHFQKEKKCGKTQPNLAEQNTKVVFVSVENGENHKKPSGVPNSSSAFWVHLSGEAGVLDPARK